MRGFCGVRGLQRALEEGTNAARHIRTSTTMHGTHAGGLIGKLMWGLMGVRGGSRRELRGECNNLQCMHLGVACVLMNSAMRSNCGKEF